MPSRPTRATVASHVPSGLFSHRGMKILAPGFRSSRSPGIKFTTVASVPQHEGVSLGLLDLLRVTAALVMELMPTNELSWMFDIDPDGTIKAVEAHVFAEPLRGIGEGHYPWDLMPNMVAAWRWHNETYAAMGMEVAVERTSGRIRVERVACAHDCGQIINPDGVGAQVEGSILQTLSRVLMEEVQLACSRVTSVDWSTYPIMRFLDVPKLDIELVDRQAQPPLGAGEAACTPVAAALANAVFDATGARLRTVPFTPQRVKAALNGA